MRKILDKIQEFKIELKGGLAIGTIILWVGAVINATLEIVILALKALVLIMQK